MSSLEVICLELELKTEFIRTSGEDPIITVVL